MRFHIMLPTSRLYKSLEMTMIDALIVLAGMSLYCGTTQSSMFYECSIEPKFSTSPLEMILSESQMAIWHDTKDKILAEMDLKRHRASYDAYIIQQTWVRTRDVKK